MYIRSLLGNTFRASCCYICMLCLTVSSCFSPAKENRQTVVDLSQILGKGVLTVATLNTSISYYIYKAQQMGYEYELIHDFANSLELDLDVKIAENVVRLVEMLRDGEVDLVAYPVQMDNTMKNKFLFCGVEQQNRLVVVQSANRGDTLVDDVPQLIGKEVWVKSLSRYHERLVNLNAELGGGIVIREIERDTITTEDLIEMVADGEIRYTISDDRLAKLNQAYYRNIDIRLPVSFPQRASWIVRKDSRALAQAVDDWASNVTRANVVRAAAKRYFERSKEYHTAEGLTVNNGRISSCDELFKRYAANTEWDWRLLASIACQESTFNNYSESWSGAKGLMGIMPRTAQNFGFPPDSLDNPDISIQAGIKCLNDGKRMFHDIDSASERLKFILASYNAGGGHVMDARNLAVKYGKNPDIWDGNVAEYIRLKSEPKYYNDSICRHGYLRGIETYRYVKDVIERYQFYLAALADTARRK